MIPSLFVLSVFVASAQDCGTVQRSAQTTEERQHSETLAHYGLARYYQQQNRLIQSEKQLRAATSIEPKANSPKRALAKLYASTGRDAPATRLAKEVLANEPNDRETAVLLARLLMDAKRPAEALAAYQLAVKSGEPIKLEDRVLLWNDYAKAATAAKDGPAAVSARSGMLQLLEKSKTELLEAKLFDGKSYELELAKQFENLGDAHVMDRNFDKAEEAFAKAQKLQSDPRNSKLAAIRLHWNRCNAFAEQGKKPEALKELSKYLEARPTGFAPYAKFVELSKPTKDQPDLCDRLADLAVSNPENTAPLWLLAAEKMSSGGLTEAKAEFRKLLSKMTKPEEANVLVAAHDNGQAYAAILELLDRQFKSARPDGFDDPDRDKEKELDDARPEAVQRARLLSTAVRQMPKDGISALVRFLDAETQRGTKYHSDLYELLMSSTRTADDLDLFAKMLPRAVQNVPKDIRLKHLAVKALATTRQWADLARQADEISRAENRRYYPGIKAQAAVAKAELGQGSVAHQILDDLGDTPYTMGYRVVVYNILGNHREALKLCDNILAMEKLNESQVFDAELKKANCLTLLGRHTECERLLRRLLDDHPDDPVLLNSLGYNLADQNRKLAEAEKLLQRAMELDKDERRRSGDFDSVSGAILDSQGWLLFRKGSFKAARESLELAVETKEEARSPIAWDHLGDVCFELNDRKAALRAWRKARGYYENSHLGREQDRLNAVKAKIKMFE
jgi:tetratricopeptide (TPR) repeat protein